MIQRNPYAVWISEVMLQQTQADRVVPFFVKFMQKFPTVRKLSEATWEEVMECVRGLGYYRRFRNLILGAEVVVRDFKGSFPSTYDGLRKIPGIGDYTAGAIMAFSYGKEVVALDTNVRQVLRYFFDAEGKMGDGELKGIAARACPRGAAREFYQGMMDFAASELESLKRAEKAAMKEARVPSAPALTSKKIARKNPATPAIKVAAAIIWRGSGPDKEVLIQRRTNKQHQNNLYEFPGGKLEPNEDERSCLKRELLEELGIEAAVRPPFLRTEHDYGDQFIKLSWHRCQILLGEPTGREGQEVRWVKITDLDQYAFPPADDEVIRELRG